VVGNGGSLTHRVAPCTVVAGRTCAVNSALEMPRLRAAETRLEDSSWRTFSSRPCAALLRIHTQHRATRSNALLPMWDQRSHLKKRSLLTASLQSAGGCLLSEDIPSGEPKPVRAPSNSDDMSTSNRLLGSEKSERGAQRSVPVASGVKMMRDVALLLLLAAPVSSFMPLPSSCALANAPALRLGTTGPGPCPRRSKCVAPGMSMNKASEMQVGRGAARPMGERVIAT